jgi:hypothetical protein
MGAGGATKGAGGAASVTVAVTVTVGGWAVTVTVFVKVDAVGLASLPWEPMLPRSPTRTSPPTMLPTTINTRLLDGHHPGIGDGGVLKKSPLRVKGDYGASYALAGRSPDPFAT